MMKGERYRFVAMNETYAREIVDTWRYEGEYAVYDYLHEAGHMLDAEGWGAGIFAVLDEDSALVGELSIEFYDSRGDYIEYSDFSDTGKINQAELWIGFGLRPDLVGRHRGAGFVEQCATYAVRHTGYRGEYVRLGVAAFNRRAISVYDRCGFIEFQRADGEIGGRTFACIYMRKRIGHEPRAREA
jgi:[ribosomal protein S18]-alanine N-acetyltransferase